MNQEIGSQIQKPQSQRQCLEELQATKIREEAEKEQKL